MGEPRPLTKEERETIEVRYADVDGMARQWIAGLLADAQFWREAVKNADVCGEIGVPCPWCGARSYDSMVEAVHLINCEYRKARE